MSNIFCYNTNSVTAISEISLGKNNAVTSSEKAADKISKLSNLKTSNKVIVTLKDIEFNNDEAIKYGTLYDHLVEYDNIEPTNAVAFFNGNDPDSKVNIVSHATYRKLQKLGNLNPITRESITTTYSINKLNDCEYTFEKNSVPIAATLPRESNPSYREALREVCSAGGAVGGGLVGFVGGTVVGALALGKKGYELVLKVEEDYSEKVIATGILGGAVVGGVSGVVGGGFSGVVVGAVAGGVLAGGMLVAGLVAGAAVGATLGFVVGPFVCSIELGKMGSTAARNLIS